MLTGESQRFYKTIYKLRLHTHLFITLRKYGVHCIMVSYNHHKYRISSKIAGLLHHFETEKFGKEN